MGGWEEVRPGECEARSGAEGQGSGFCQGTPTLLSLPLQSPRYNCNTCDWLQGLAQAKPFNPYPPNPGL